MAGEPGVSGSDGLLPTDIQQDGTRVTKDQVSVQLESRTQAASRLMDSIEESRASQGDYFVRLGGKKDNGEDNRVIIFRQLVDSGGRNGFGQINEYFVITPMGPRKITTSEVEIDNPVAFAIRLEDQGLVGDPSIKEGRYKAGEVLRAPILSQEGEPTVRHVEFEMNYLRDSDNEKFKEAVRKSIDKAESPLKRILERAIADKVQTNAAQGIISNLSPRE